MMLAGAVSILQLVALLSGRAQRGLCSPASGSGSVSTNGSSTSSGLAWGRPFGGALPEDGRFYTLDYAATGVKPRARTPKGSKLRREPRFISFETKDNSIEVEIDFAIPFLSIPIQRSMDGVMSSVLKGTPLLNVNLGAVVMAGVLTAGGALVGAAARTFSNSSLLPGWTLPLTRPAQVQRAESRHSQDERGDAQEASLLWTLLGSLDRTMEQYDIDTVACAQRTVCWYVKEATVAVGDGRASAVDTIVEGLSRADWMGRFTAGTAVERAIRAGRGKTSCEKSFPDCAITKFVDRVVRLARKR